MQNTQAQSQPVCRQPAGSQSCLLALVFSASSEQKRKVGDVYFIHSLAGIKHWLVYFKLISTLWYLNVKDIYVFLTMFVLSSVLAVDFEQLHAQNTAHTLLH
jgi:hypothetical protein